MKKLVSLMMVLCLILTCVSFAGAEDGYVKLTWAMGTGDVAPKDNAAVLEVLNEMTREKIGVEVDIQYFTNDELQLSIQSGEVYDIYFTCSWYNNTNQCISQNLFLGLTQEEIAEAAPGLYAAMSKEVWDLAESSDGYIYAIPNKKDYAAENFITYPADIAAELGYEIPEVLESWDELTDFLVAWKETMPEGEYPIYIGGAAPGWDSSFDFIDRTALIGCIYGTTDVVFEFEDPEIWERALTIAKWYDLGLINPDAAQLTETAFDDLKPWCHFAQAWDGYDGYTVSWGYNVGMTRFAGPNLSVDSVQGSMNAFSITLKDDEEKLDAALKLFELIHTDKLVADTLRFGVQGKHWNYVEDETSPCYKCVISTKEGQDNYAAWGFAQPAYFFTSITASEAQLKGEAAAPNINQYEQYYAAVATSANASAMGSFKWDSSAFIQQLAEINAIKEEYTKNYSTGTISIEECYDEFLAKMNAAGLQDIIDDAQAQLDAYLAAN